MKFSILPSFALFFAFTSALPHSLPYPPPPLVSDGGLEVRECAGSRCAKRSDTSILDLARAIVPRTKRPISETDSPEYPAPKAVQQSEAPETPEPPAHSSDPPSSPGHAVSSPASEGLGTPPPPAQNSVPPSSPGAPPPSSPASPAPASAVGPSLSDPAKAPVSTPDSAYGSRDGVILYGAPPVKQLPAGSPGTNPNANDPRGPWYKVKPNGQPMSPTFFPSPPPPPPRPMPSQGQ